MSNQPESVSKSLQIDSIIQASPKHLKGHLPKVGTEEFESFVLDLTHWLGKQLQVFFPPLLSDIDSGTIESIDKWVEAHDQFVLSAFERESNVNQEVLGLYYLFSRSLERPNSWLFQQLFTTGVHHEDYQKKRQNIALKQSNNSLLALQTLNAIAHHWLKNNHSIFESPNQPPTQYYQPRSLTYWLISSKVAIKNKLAI